MKKMFLLHDLDIEEQAAKEQLPEEALVFGTKPRIKRCIGCFGCWLKTPGICVIKDRAQHLSTMLSSCDQLIIISRLVYGGFSAEIKNAMDRSIGYLQPYFQMVNHEMHHVKRYENKISMIVHFYSTIEIDTEEEQVAINLADRTATNLGAKSVEAFFYNNIQAHQDLVLIDLIHPHL